MKIKFVVMEMEDRSARKSAAVSEHDTEELAVVEIENPIKSRPDLMGFEGYWVRKVWTND